MVVVGVDGRRSGWITVALDSGRFAGASRFASFRQLVDSVAEALAVVVNVPLGLVDEGTRECDRLARELVAPQVERAPLAPPRPSLVASAFSDARDMCYHLSGWLLSEEAFRIRDKVIEIDAVLADLAQQEPRLYAQQPRHSVPAPYRDSKLLGPQAPNTHARRIDSPEGFRRYARVIDRRGGRKRRTTVRMRGLRAAGRIAEGHAELSFRAIAGQTVRSERDSPEGIVVRTKLLRDAGVDVPAVLGLIGGVPPSDVLDAAALAWTAHRYGAGQAYSLPADDAWQLDGERLVALWV